MRVFAPSRRALLALGGLALATPASGRNLYRFGASVGRLEFSARHFGLLSSTGRFEDFEAVLLIDPARPVDAEVEVRVRTGRVTLPYPGAEDLLRSPEFFDSDRHPEARFLGRAEAQAGGDRFAIQGDLTLRDITRPMAMQARLLERRRDAEGEVARFEARGELRRSAYGMTAERLLISDAITLSVAVTIRV